MLYDKGGTALLAHLDSQPIPAEPLVAEEWRKLIGYFKNNEHRTDYPTYRSHGYDIGSGPTEAGCKIVGARLKGSGMRWLEVGAAQVAPLRALYESGAAAWDASPWRYDLYLLGQYTRAAVLVGIVSHR
ncbi:MAG: hypothetical protein U0797_15505 [Gemmataceae bacterium]